jgi:hypothetical protein
MHVHRALGFMLQIKFAGIKLGRSDIPYFPQGECRLRVAAKSNRE